MNTQTSGNFISHRAWFRSIITEDVVLCGVSALECLDMFTGYLDESNVYVYAKQEGVYSNICYTIIDNFDNIDCVKIGNLICTSFEQTVNDMLSDFENIDKGVLIEALSNFYYSNSESFSGLKIKPENRTNFEAIMQDAIEYYTGQV